jgi:hypothetical protein
MPRLLEWGHKTLQLCRLDRLGSDFPVPGFGLHWSGKLGRLWKLESVGRSNLLRHMLGI